MGEKVLSQYQFQVNVGFISITWNPQGKLTQIDWSETARSASEKRVVIPTPILDTIAQLKDYFQSGEPIQSIPWASIAQEGWSPFQVEVYRAITQIPHGETRTYGWVAARVGKLNATRAVGQALRHNPLPILIPCHRVVSTTSLGGFMGSSDPNQPELCLKKKLIAIEEEYRNPVFSFILDPPFDLSLNGATG